MSTAPDNLESMGLQGIFETVGFEKGLAVYTRGLIDATKATQQAASQSTSAGKTIGTAVGGGMQDAAAMAAPASFSIVGMLGAIASAVGPVGIAIGVMAGAVIASVGASVIAVKGLIGEITNLAQQAAPLSTIAEVFETTAGRAGLSLQGLREAAHGTIWKSVV